MKFVKQSLPFGILWVFENQCEPKGFCSKISDLKGFRKKETPKLQNQKNKFQVFLNFFIR